MSRLRWLVGAALMNVAMAAPVFAQERCTAQPVASLPFVMMGNKILVPVQINEQPALFAVDTGTNISAISQTAVARLKLKTFGIRNSMVRGIGGTKFASFAQIDTMVIDNLRARDDRFLVSTLGSGTDGLLGADYLRNFDLDFDFAANRLTLYRPRSCEGAPPGTGKFSKIEMDVLRSGHLRIPVMLDGKRLWAMVDTGAPGTIITASAARSYFDVEASESNRLKIYGATGGSEEIAPHTFGSLSIGEFSQASPVLAVAVDNDVRFLESQLLLGMAQMKGLRLYLSYRERNLYVSRPDASSAPAASSRPSTLPPQVPALTPADAIARVAAGDSSEAVFTFLVRNAGVSGGNLYLNSEDNYRDARNVAARFSGAAMVDLGQRLGADPLRALRGKSIRVSGAPRQEPLLDRDGKVVGTQVLIPITDAARLEVLP